MPEGLTPKEKLAWKREQKAKAEEMLEGLEAAAPDPEAAQRIARSRQLLAKLGGGLGGELGGGLGGTGGGSLGDGGRRDAAYGASSGGGILDLSGAAGGAAAGAAGGAGGYA